MNRRGFIKIFSGAIAALPLLKWLPRSEPILEETPAIKKFMAAHASPQRIDRLAIEHWGKFAPTVIEDADAGGTVFLVNSGYFTAPPLQGGNHETSI